jgi:hypothetical protein
MLRGLGGWRTGSVGDVIRWRRGVVSAVRAQWPGAVELTVQVDGETLPALAYPALVGTPEVGDVVLLNVNALLHGLGTGGLATVVALPERLPPDTAPAGHLVKARYTPLQVMVAGADEPGGAHHHLLAEADDLSGMPVVVADLHSALPAICAAIEADRPGTRVVHVSTDGGALPVWFSRAVAGLRAAGRLVATVSTGQCFGGDLETVTVHSGLLAARLVVDAEIAVITQGPGNLGTDSRWGFSGVAAGEAVNATAVLGGRPVGALRISAADPRERHRGVSHHSLTAYGRVALAAADIAVPRLPGAFGARVRTECAELATRHRLVDVDLGGLDAALRASPVGMSSMGRGLDEDPSYFLAAAAAGRLAAGLLAG